MAKNKKTKKSNPTAWIGWGFAIIGAALLLKNNGKKVEKTAPKSALKN